MSTHRTGLARAVASGQPVGGGGGAGCGCVHQPMARGSRIRTERPFTGSYVLDNDLDGWVPPADSQHLGYGPVQFIGVFDTMPWLEAYDDAQHDAMLPAESPGGVVLRWLAPRRTHVVADLHLTQIAPALVYPASLTLYAAAFDVLPRGWADAGQPTLPDTVYPGTYPGMLANTDDNAEVWAQGILTAARGAGAYPGTMSADYNGRTNDPLNYLARHVARPVLEMLAYCGGPGAEADISELAGGGRYQALWARFWWPRYEGTDPFETISLEVPWTVLPGRAVNAGHRQAWHVSLPVLGPDIADPAVMVTPTLATVETFARFGVCSPISGRWRATIASNGDAAAAPVFVALELRAGDRLAVDSGSCAYNDHGAVLDGGIQHGGAGVVGVCTDTGAGDDCAALVSISVVP